MNHRPSKVSSNRTPSPNMVSTANSNSRNSNDRSSGTRLVHDQISSDGMSSHSIGNTVNSKVNRVVTPVPHKRLKTKQPLRASRLGKSSVSPPLHQDNHHHHPIHNNNNNAGNIRAKALTASINPRNGMPPHSTKSMNSTISFSDILNLSNLGDRRDRISSTTTMGFANHSAQSSFLMPSSMNPQRPLSPSATHTDVSVDTVADYELRPMPDGGMKHISQSFGVGKEKAVGVILEEDEVDHSVSVDMMRGKKMENAPSRSVSATDIDQDASPSPDPTRVTPSQDTTQMTREHGHRVSSLGLPPNISFAGQLVQALSEYSNAQRKRARSQMTTNRNDPSQEEQAQFILNIENPHGHDQDHNRGVTD